MSKMPAKKKSCFQITSVTQAQVAAVGAADDAESLDDPDESRTEDVSSEKYDMPRAEYDAGCDRSSSEEALDNVVEPEVTAAPSTPQPAQLTGLSSNPSYQLPGIGVVTPGSPLVTQPGTMQQQSAAAAAAASAGPASVPVNTSQAAATVTSSAPPPATSTVGCTSRFRVIKLDHGIGEPFRRGRWTCTEFYEKDSEGSAVGRTVDGIRHASAALDPAAERDSGLGQTGGSAVAPSTLSGQGLGSVADVSLSSPRMHSVETLSQQQQQQIPYQNYSAWPQGVTGSTTQSAFSGSKPTTVPAQPALGSLQSSAPQSGQNGPPQSAVHTQKSPIVPPSAQPVTYHPQQHPLGHHLTSQSEYYQQPQPTSMQPGLATGQPLPLSSLSAGPQPLVLPPASGGTSLPGQVGDAAGAAGGSVSTGQPGLSQQQTGGMGGVGASMLTGVSTLQQPQQQPVNQYAAAGQPQPHGLHPVLSGVHNVPASAVSSSVPATVPTAVPSASSAAVPNVTTSSLPPGQQPHGKPPAGQGLQGPPAAGFGHAEGGGGKSEDLVNTQSPLALGNKELQALRHEGLQLTTPTVNSLFGIQIHVDGEGDRNPSKAFYQAFQSGTRLRDSKAHSDRASGSNVAAIDNKIEQAMDLVKSHLMYAVREEVEVLKEHIKELYERNSVLERENAVLKSLANSEQLSQLSTPPPPPAAGTAPPQPPPPSHPQQLQHQPNPNNPNNPQQLQTPLDPGQQQQQQPQPSVTSA